MLPKGNRLTNKKDIDNVHKKGAAYLFGSVRLLVAKNNQKQTRSAFIVGLGVDKRATQRNKIKRSLRGLFKEKIGSLEGQRDILVIVKKIKQKGATKQGAREDFQGALEAANLIKK